MILQFIKNYIDTIIAIFLAIGLAVHFYELYYAISVIFVLFNFVVTVTALFDGSKLQVLKLGTISICLYGLIVVILIVIILYHYNKNSSHDTRSHAGMIGSQADNMVMGLFFMFVFAALIGITSQGILMGISLIW